MTSWDHNLQRLLKEAAVPGAALAVIRSGRLERLSSHGVRGIPSAAPVDQNTIFEAASLSKPVFAYIALQLLDQGKLELDARLGDCLPNYIATDARSSSITVRHVLSHSSGLPNWRNSDYPLRTYFEPGERFSYSGEGFLYLQRAVEAITGEELDVLARRLVFEPLAMSRSSFVWRPDFLENCAYPHDAFGTPALMYKPGVANVAWSLQTCAPDYAKFLLAVMEGSRLSSATARLWLEPAIEVRHKGAQSLEPGTADVTTGVAWGLGWGLEPGAGTFFHWGDNGPFTAFTIGSRAHQAALVFFANGASGLSVLPDIVAQLAPGEHPSLKWLDRSWHDAPVRRLLRAVLARGVEAAWPEIEKAALPVDQVLWIAQGLNAKGRVEESAWLRTRADPKG